MGTVAAILGIVVLVLLVTRKTLVRDLDTLKNNSEMWRTHYEETNVLFLGSAEKADELRKKYYTLLEMFDKEKKEKNQELVQVRATINNLKHFLESGVFYDNNNDTIVVVKELERLGDL